MSSTIFITLLIALFIKHIIVVFVIQTQHQLDHKTDCYHSSGLMVSLYHFLGTVLVLSLVLGFRPSMILVALITSAIRHYVDWAKANVVAHWLPETLEQKWWILGVDQWIHCVLYVLVVGFYAR
jgi:hypothetical protein